MQVNEALLQKIENWCAASIRALSNDSSVNYKGHQLYVKGKIFPLGVAYLHLDIEVNHYQLIRGAADGIALNLSYSNRELHMKLMPSSYLERWIFEILEQLRVESLCPLSLPGVKINLQRRFSHWVDKINASDFIENQSGILIFSIVIMCWSKLSGHQPSEVVETTIESTRLSASQLIGMHLIKLKKYRKDQLLYSHYALAIAQKVQSAINYNFKKNGNKKETIESLLKKFQSSLYLLFGDTTSIDEFGSNADNKDNSILQETQNHYKVFDPSYDEEADIHNLVREEWLKKARTDIDKRFKKQHINISRLIRYFKQIFLQPVLSDWSFYEEEGFIDSSKLSRIVTSENYRNLFRLETNRSQASCAVTILIDNSGSMKTYAHNLVIIVDILVCSLEMADIKVEVLGFTTREWNGGRPYKQWLSCGQVAMPGRLNELRYIIYKSSEAPWKKSRCAIAGLLKEDLYKESLAGEALLWAEKRISKKKIKNKIIMVISDGSPMDTATTLTNNHFYTCNHLQTVVKKIEKKSTTKLCALGLGLDLSNYYSHSLMMTSQELYTKDFFEIANLLRDAK